MYCSHITTWREVRLRTCCPRPHTTELPLQRSKGPVRTSPKSKFHSKTSDPSYVKSSKNECQTIELCLWMWRIGTADQLFILQDKKSVKTFLFKLNIFSIVIWRNKIVSIVVEKIEHFLSSSSSRFEHLNRHENWTFLINIFPAEIPPKCGARF